MRLRYYQVRPYQLVKSQANDVHESSCHGAQYTLLEQNPLGKIFENKSRVLYHILPATGDNDRGRR